MTSIIEPDNRPPPKMGNRTVVYRPNHRSFGAFMRSEQMRDVTEKVAEDIVPEAAALTPRRKDRGKVPDAVALADNFKVKREAGLMKVSGNLRVRVDVYNDKRHAAAMEFGFRPAGSAPLEDGEYDVDGKVARHRMLARAGALFGDFKAKGDSP